MTTQEKSRKYYEEHKEILKLKSREFYKNNKDRIKQYKHGIKPKRNPINTRKRILKSRYKITPEEYDILLLSQNNCCAICGRNQSEFRKRLSVDHNHSNGKVRGLLCQNCNSGIGGLQDSPTLLIKAADYLNSYLSE